MSHDELGQLSFHAAVARMGSALGAAPALGVNQTTVVRRVVQMEDSLGGILFERRQSGPQITSLGERIATAEEHWRPEKAEALMVVGMEGAPDNLPPPRWLARMTPNYKRDDVNWLKHTVAWKDQDWNVTFAYRPGEGWNLVDDP